MSPLSNTDRLLELPLFLGMSRSDLNDVAAVTQCSIRRVSSGKIIVAEDDVCTQLLFLLEGEMTTERSSADNGYTLKELLRAPDVLQPECLFGLTQRYSRTFVTLNKCQILAVDKTEVIRLMEQYSIFRLNFINIVSTQAQKQARMPWRNAPQSIRQKIRRFTERHCMRPAGYKCLNIKMERLAREIGESRLNVSKELRRMQGEGLITLKRGEIGIPALEMIN